MKQKIRWVKKLPISVQPNLLEGMAEVMMHQVSWMGKVLTDCAKPLTAPALLEGIEINP